MDPFGMELSKSDPVRLGKGIIEGLKAILPFREARFLPCEENDEVLAALGGINLSDRQRERAEKRIVLKNGFWDRIGQKALVPVLSGKREGLLGLYEFSGVPRDISPQEAGRALEFLKITLRDQLFLSKLSKAAAEADRPPGYIAHLLGDHQSAPLHLIQLSFHRKVPPLKEAEEILAEAFPGSRLEFAGRSCSTFWFAVHQQDHAGFSKGIRRLALLLSKNRRHFRAILGHLVHNGPDEIARGQHVARGLNAAVLIPSAVDEILLKTGASLDSRVFRPEGIKAGPRSCCILLTFESLASGKKIQKFFNKHEKGGRIIKAGNRCLMIHFRNPGFEKGGTGLENWAHDTFKHISRASGSKITAGFSCSSQQFVSASFLPYFSLLALLHAHLLGRGRMAVFNHVSFNVHGDLLVSWGDVTGACAAYRKGLKLRPGDKNLLNSLGVCLADLRRFKEAKDCFQQVLSRSPDNFMALYNLSGINLDTGRLEDAESQARRAYAMDPHNPAALLRLAGCWMKQKRFRKTFDLLRPEVSRQHSPPFSLLRMCGRAAIETGNWLKARDILGHCLNLKKNDPLCLALLAKGYSLFEQDRETASRFMEKISSEDLNLREIRKIIRQMEKEPEKLRRTSV